MSVLDFVSESESQAQVGVAWIADEAEMKVTHLCTNGSPTAPQTEANGASVTARIWLRDAVTVEKQDVGQARTALEATALWDVVNVKERAVLQAGKI